MANTEGTISLPKQQVKKGRGITGYKGKDIEIVNREGKVVGKGQYGDDSKSKTAKKS